MPLTAVRRVALIALLVLATACRVDVTVEVAVRPDGTGTVTLVAIADAEVVAQAPGLAGDLRFDDMVDAGWVVDGPTPTDDGGLRVALSHEFATVEQANALLQSINGPSGPLQAVTLAREVNGDTGVVTLSGSLRVDGGLTAFADPEVLASLGGAPYAESIAALGLGPAGVVSITFAAELPGSIDPTTGTIEDGAATWIVPLDGTPVDVATTATRSGGNGGGFWGAVSTVAFIALIAWCVLAVAFIALVVVKRKQRARRRQQRRVTPHL